MFGPGMVLPEYREGDSVWPGRPVIDVIEVGKMEVRAKVDESDRTNLDAGQTAVDRRRHAAGRDVQGPRRRALGQREPRVVLRGASVTVSSTSSSISRSPTPDSRLERPRAS